MFAANTTFVLGAGASKPHGFPLGHELIEKIYSEILAQGDFFNDVLRETDAGKNEVISFGKRLQGSGVKSIDEFLREQRNHGRFAQIGKICIARSLLELEKHEAVMGLGNKNGQWYRELGRVLFSEAGEGDLNDIAFPTFITFNYDRSLEYFLMNTIRDRYGYNDDREAAAVLRRIPIFHAYGQLGYLPEMSTDDKFVSVGFGDTASIKVAAQGIRIVWETKQSNYEDKRRVLFQHMMNESEHVIVTGIGFLKENVEYIFLHRRTRNTYVSMHEIDENRRVKIKSELLQGKNLEVIHEASALEMMRLSCLNL